MIGSCSCLLLVVFQRQLCVCSCVIPLTCPTSGIRAPGNAWGLFGGVDQLEARARASLVIKIKHLQVETHCMSFKKVKFEYFSSLDLFHNCFLIVLCWGVRGDGR